jgi:hypothetical protein
LACVPIFPENLINELSNADGKSAAVYYDCCPMAKAYWVSEEGNIVNPYLGQSMPTCGSVKDTLKAYR